MVVVAYPLVRSLQTVVFVVFFFLHDRKKRYQVVVV